MYSSLIKIYATISNSSEQIDTRVLTVAEQNNLICNLLSVEALDFDLSHIVLSFHTKVWHLKFSRAFSNLFANFYFVLLIMLLMMSNRWLQMVCSALNFIFILGDNVNETTKFGCLICGYITLAKTKIWKRFRLSKNKTTTKMNFARWWIEVEKKKKKKCNGHMSYVSVHHFWTIFFCEFFFWPADNIFNVVWLITYKCIRIFISINLMTRRNSATKETIKMQLAAGLRHIDNVFFSRRWCTLSM